MQKNIDEDETDKRKEKSIVQAPNREAEACECNKSHIDDNGH